jgi:hypothetical protein
MIQKILLFLLCAVLFLGCHTGHESPFSLQYWQTKREVEGLLEEGRRAENERRWSYAIGKLRKAYRLAPENKDLPLRIARLYAHLVQESSENQHAREESLGWLYRAYLIDADLNVETLTKKPLSILEKSPLYQTILKQTALKTGEKPGDYRTAVRILNRFNAMMAEMSAILKQVGQVLNQLAQIGEWLGFQVLLFICLILLFSFLLRLVGFPLGPSLWLVSTLLTTLFWHGFYRVLSGGQSGGWQPILKLLGVTFALFIGGFLCKILMTRLFFLFRRWLITSKGFQKTFTRILRKKTRESNLNFRRFLFDLEETQAELVRLGHQYLAAQTDEEMRQLSLKIEIKRQEIHHLTREGNHPKELTPN